MKSKNEIVVPLPLFQGFYGTCYEINWEEYEEIVEKRISDSEYLGNPTSYGDYEFDEPSYELTIAKLYVREFKKYTPEYVKDIEVLRIIHPREYNHKNDEIEVRIRLSEDFRVKIRDFVVENEKWLRIKIKEDWSDRPGFWSFMSNDFNKWVKYLEQPEITGVNSNYIAEIIKYDMLNDDNDVTDRIDQDVLENISLDDFIKCVKR